MQHERAHAHAAQTRTKVRFTIFSFVVPFFSFPHVSPRTADYAFPSPPQAGPDPWHMPGPGGMRVALTITKSTQ